MWLNSRETERKGRTYFSVQRIVEKEKFTFKCKRRDAVVVSRLRFGLYVAEEWAGSDW